MFGQFYEPLLNNVSEIFSSIFTWSNIILSTMFFLIANKIINFSQKLEIKENNIKLRLKKVEFMTKYGVFIFGSLSIASLFCIFQNFLLMCFNFLPISPFLLIIRYIDTKFIYSNIESDSIFNYGFLQHFDTFSPVQRFVVVSTAIISFISFCLFIVGFYNILLKKIKHDKKLKWPFYTIGFFALSCFFGLPLMLRFITFRI